MLALLIGCVAVDDTAGRSPAERLDAALPGLAAAVGRYTDDLEPVADVVDAASPTLVHLLLPARLPTLSGGELSDLVGESPDADLLSAGVTLDGTVLTGVIRGTGVAESGGWLLVDGRDGPAPDLLLGFGDGWVRAATVDSWAFGPQVALAGTSSVEHHRGSADAVRFTVDLASTDRVAPGHAGAVTALLKSADETVWDFGPAGATGRPDPHAVATLVRIAAVADGLEDPDLAVAVALDFGGWRGLVTPEVRAEVEGDAVDWYRYGIALDEWLALQDAGWTLRDQPPAAKLLWAWPSAQSVVYGAFPVGMQAAALSRERYRFDVPDVDTLAALRDDLPVADTAWETASARDEAIWGDLDYRASDAGMAALCDAHAIDATECFRWGRDRAAGRTLGEVDGVAVALDKGTSAALQVRLHDEHGHFVGDCGTATALAMTAFQAVGLVPLGVGYAGPSWAYPTHDFPLVLDGDRFVAPQATPGAKWAGSDTFVYATVPMLDPALGTPLGWEPNGWTRGGSVAGGTITYGALDRWVSDGIPLSTVLGWTEDARGGDWPAVTVP
jgi:hypothetical protein